MKYFGALLSLIFLSAGASAQIQQVNVCSGDTAYLHPASYHGNVSWESSSDSVNWQALVSLSDTLTVTDTTALIYRAIVKDGTCDSVVSDTVLVQFFPVPSQAHAGPDANITGAVSTTLNAVPITVGTGTWSIISGTGGVIADTHNPQSTFTGVGATSYTLVWTVSNECRSTKDTVVVSFAMPSLNCNGTMYVHPTDNHGGAIWGCNGTTTNATSLTNGEQNTTLIINACTDLTIAARKCSELVAFGFSDWYLPAINELECIYDNKSSIGGFPTVSGIVYWSSTETNANWANAQNFTNGTITTINQKAGACRVRCVRRD